MVVAVERLYQEIGGSVLGQVEEGAGKVLVYAEVEDGVISSGVFYFVRPGLVRFKVCSPSVKSLVCALWESWKSLPGNREWRVLCYILDSGKFSIDLTYPDQIHVNEDITDRRPRAIKQYFGEVQVDYSMPRG